MFQSCSSYLARALHVSEHKSAVLRLQPVLCVQERSEGGSALHGSLGHKQVVNVQPVGLQPQQG